MEKHIYNEQTGISYTLHGDYYLPDLALSDEEKGRRNRRMGTAVLTIYQTTPQGAIS